MKKTVYIQFLIIAGVIGAVLRALSMTAGLEPETGLPVRGYLPSTLLIVLCVAVLAVSVLLCRKRYKTEQPPAYETLLGNARFGIRILCVACAIAMATVGAAALVSVGSMVAEQTSEYQPFGMTALIALIVDWLMCIVSGLSMAVFAWKQDGSPATKWKGMLVTIPMFWACLDLIMTYHENSGNPVGQDYALDLLQVIAMIAAFYYIAALFFAECKPVHLALFSGLASFLTLVCCGGIIIAFGMDAVSLLNGLTAPLADLFRFLVRTFVGVYLFGQLTQLRTEPLKGEKSRP